ncbi:hypothetical protein [Mycobacterium lepromatosis]|nr:hypothetical protein [Mycobacterium lepromatosis]
MAYRVLPVDGFMLLYTIVGLHPKGQKNAQRTKEQTVVERSLNTREHMGL